MHFQAGGGWGATPRSGRRRSGQYDVVVSRDDRAVYAGFQVDVAPVYQVDGQAVVDIQYAVGVGLRPVREHLLFALGCRLLTVRATTSR